MKKQMVSSPSRDSAIIARFNAMTDMEIEQRFRTAGGLFAENCFSERPLGSVVSERPDRWILETRAAPGGGNNVWIKSTCKIISDQERIWVLDWLKSLGFDEAEAIVYFSGNTPRKRDIAKQVGDRKRAVTSEDRSGSDIYAVQSDDRSSRHFCLPL